MFIGEAARLSATTIKTLRHYESIGLMPPARRQGKYRVYDQHAVELLRLIKCAQQLGFTLREMQALMAGGQPSHGLFNELVQISDVVARLRHLWQRLHQEMPEVCRQAGDRLRLLFGTVHFLLRVLAHSAEPVDWQAQSRLWAEHEAALLLPL